MDLRSLEYFVAVADELNFTRAAQRCHVVQSALSYQIARLERESGVLLFERTSRSVRLAPGGEVLLPRARSILAEAELARSELDELAGVLTGKLRIGMIGSAVLVAPVLERVLGEFHRRHPAVEITVTDTGSALMAEQVRTGLLDLAVIGLFADQVPADLVHAELAVEPLVAVVGPDNPLADRPVIDLAELAGTGGFVEMREQAGVRHQVDAAFARIGITRTIAIELATSDAVVRYVGLGFGVALVPLSATTGRAGVRVLPVSDPLARHPVSLVHRSPEPAAPSARAFLALVTGGTDLLTAPPRGR